MSGATPTHPPYAEGHFTFYQLMQSLDFSESCILSKRENGKISKILISIKLGFRYKVHVIIDIQM